MTAEGELGVHVGVVIMVGTLLGLIALIYGLVLRFDPEAREPARPSSSEPVDG